ncbi:hypothetical protein PoB_001650300 [Plakobranchus ocellatus]|uniref:Uncharacterized protein n=1 Tax=Plakobranchus ocellatus TaxID=259542 RepID=A0AAV3Z5Q8_9GAST|nr:hypothetical protein PoB_001650300 [Plakobranchus ocellatus]
MDHMLYLHGDHKLCSLFRQIAVQQLPDFCSCPVSKRVQHSIPATGSPFNARTCCLTSDKLAEVKQIFTSMEKGNNQNIKLPFAITILHRIEAKWWTAPMWRLSPPQ